MPRDDRGVALPSEEALVLDRMGIEDEATRDFVRSLWRHAAGEAEFERASVREEKTAKRDE